jgi:hypothetical protein
MTSEAQHITFARRVSTCGTCFENGQKAETQRRRNMKVKECWDGLFTWGRGGAAVIEASELGLAPGEWPDALRLYDEPMYSRRQEALFDFHSIDATGAHVYFCEAYGGSQITVLND